MATELTITATLKKGRLPPAPPIPSQRQIEIARQVVAWYFRTYFGTEHDPGLASTFCSRERIGHFAIGSDDFERGSEDALFRMLVATSMFQRRQDVQIMRVLKGISKADVAEMSSRKRLVRLAIASSCEHARSNEELLARCDLHKIDGAGGCRANMAIACRLKIHTVVLKRYGHFGKVPTSLAHVLTKHGGLSGLLASTRASHETPRARGRAIFQVLTQAWRISDKIASMFLSALSNPDLSALRPPWETEIDWTDFVVIDSNVDAFLAAIRYRGFGTYAARKDFIEALACNIDLTEFRSSVHAFNPRVVQQALYLFMSATNRRASPIDCSHSNACNGCPPALRRICPSRS